MRNIAKLVVALAICSLTWLATSAIIAQQVQKVSSSDHSSNSIKRDSIVKAVGSIPLGEPIPEIALPPGSIPRPDHTELATFALKSFDIKIRSNRAEIRAAVDMFDRRQQMQYIWMLKITPVGGGEISKNIYDHQVFQVGENRRLQPTFHEMLELPPGHFNLELGLYGFVAGSNLSFLDDEFASSNHQLIGAQGKVTVNLD